jgi:hypothetical protein
MNKRIVFFVSLVITLLLAPGMTQARYLNGNTGCFQTMDSYEGNNEDPLSLHKYLYGADNPVDNDDPSGNEVVGNFAFGGIDLSSFDATSIGAIGVQVQSLAQQVVTGRRFSSKAFWVAYLKVNYDTIHYYENKKVWQLIGGNLGKHYGETHPVTDSCATRLSYGLNYGGAPIPASAPGANRNFSNVKYNNVKGDDKYYIISAANMQSYLKGIWGAPDYRQVGTMSAIYTIVSGLQTQQVALFATRGEYGFGHSGALKQGYHDPYIDTELPVDVWKLNVP